MSNNIFLSNSKITCSAFSNLVRSFLRLLMLNMTAIKFFLHTSTVADPGIVIRGAMSSVAGARMDRGAEGAPRGRCGEDVPLGRGLGKGLCSLTRKICQSYTCNSRFLVHVWRFSQFSYLV